MVTGADGALSPCLLLERGLLGIKSFGAPTNPLPVILVNPGESVKLPGSIEFFMSETVGYT
jgi:hypothetical protein